MFFRKRSSLERETTYCDSCLKLCRCPGCPAFYRALFAVCSLSHKGIRQFRYSSLGLQANRNFLILQERETSSLGYNLVLDVDRKECVEMNWHYLLPSKELKVRESKEEIWHHCSLTVHAYYFSCSSVKFSCGQEIHIQFDTLSYIEIMEILSHPLLSLTKGVFVCL